MDNDDAQPIGGTETRLQAEESLKKALERSESAAPKHDCRLKRA
jgi:hypothetical protein